MRKCQVIFAQTLSLLVFALTLSNCTRSNGPAPEVREQNPEVEATLRGWMGRYSWRDEGHRKLLTEQEGWERLRDMALLEGVQVFSASQQPSDRIGAGRCYLALAELFEALDGLLLEAESAYLESLGDDIGAAEKARRGFVRLRRGQAKRAELEFEGTAPGGFEHIWALGRAGVAAVEGRPDEARRRMNSAPPDREAERNLVQVCCYLWGVPCPYESTGVYGRSLAAFERGDLAGGIITLQMLEFTSDGPGAGPDLFLYPLLRRGFAGLALSAFGNAPTGGAAFYAAQAREHVDDYEGAAALYQLVGAGEEAESDAAWIFSPYHGRDEAARVAEIRRGAALIRAGRGPDELDVWSRSGAANDLGALGKATLAALQVEASANAPLESPQETADKSLAVVLDSPKAWAAGENTDLLGSVYPARVAAVSRLAARVYRSGESEQRAADIMERAHRKSGGYRPDFVNPPAFMVDLARARLDAGEYASAVAVMFELARERPSARLGYESLKRLYASRTGGDVPPR